MYNVAYFSLWHISQVKTLLLANVFVNISSNNIFCISFFVQVPQWIKVKNMATFRLLLSDVVCWGFVPLIKQVFQNVKAAWTFETKLILSWKYYISVHKILHDLWVELLCLLKFNSLQFAPCCYSSSLIRQHNVGFYHISQLDAKHWSLNCS